MRVAFAGTPHFAATILRAIHASEHEVALAISQPDRRRGRGRKQTRTPVATLADELNIPLVQPESPSEVAAQIAETDALVVAAYGRILRADTLYAARHDAWNVHASLLPKYRGAAPIERAIMAGETLSGVTIMKMDEGLDTGPMALQRSIPITPEMNAGELTDTIASAGSKAIVEVLSSLEEGDITLISQDSLKATYAAKLGSEDQVLDWGGEAQAVHDHVRALAPHIGARTFLNGGGEQFKVWRSVVAGDEAPGLESGQILAANGRIFVGCGNGVLEVLELQTSGAKRLASRDYLLGRELVGRFGGALPGE